MYASSHSHWWGEVFVTRGVCPGSLSGNFFVALLLGGLEGGLLFEGLPRGALVTAV